METRDHASYPVSNTGDILGLLKLENELVEYQPTYDDISRRSELLAEDQFLSDEDKQALNEDMEDVKTRWDNVANVKEQKMKRVENRISQKEKRKLNDLIDCRADIKNLNDWITNKNNQFDRLSPVADDLPTLLKQRDELKDFSKDIADHDPKFTECIQSAHKLSKDPALSKDESDVIQKDAEKCEERWDGLNEKVRQRVESIVEQLPPLQRKQKELLGDWDDKLDRFKKSIKKSYNNLDEQRAKWPLKEDKLVSSVDLTDELIERVDQNETVEWRPTVDTSNEQLAKIRVKLQRIQRDKKNRKWSFIEAIKGVFGFGRKPKKTGINLDSLIIQFEEHEDLMQEVSSLQRPANEIVDSCNTITASRDVEEQNIMKVDGEMRAVNAQWNTLNFKVIERENR
ncbi:microtubule-actin cross-linking factor 1-like [Actinia tenebrosa]|uniref:Microtubule-actin cross-linking factor 1-like n=1 Tax=Actinia tenebrosa TaxID=6105 RepID=A0A6P8IKP4_ACTTE|nr:microtubule-actin cross-linking factor 1-like [Actinia tenebrosa]